MKVTQLADRFGSNRMNAERPGRLLAGCTCINIPFAGGLCEVPHMPDKAIINVNDLDRHVINLARVVKDKRQELEKMLDNITLIHPDQLDESQFFCRQIETGERFKSICDIEWAYHYFNCSWLGRGAAMGADGEFDQSMSVRWKSGGGNTAVRFRGAIKELAAWEVVAKKCNFTTLDAFEMLAKLLEPKKDRDIPENGIYCDAPWPGDGDNYTHKFDTESQRCLADVLGRFEQTKVVIRYGDHALIRELYQPPRWRWIEVTSRTQANKGKAEALIVNRNVKG